LLALLHILDALFTGDGLLRTFAGAGVRAGALTSDRQAAAVTYAAVATDIFQSGDVLCDLSAELAFDGVVLVQQGRHAGNFVFVQIAGTGVRIDTGFVTQFAGNSRSYPVQVLQGDEGRFIGRNINAQETRHVSSAPSVSSCLTLPLFVAGVTAHHKDHATAADDLAVVAQAFDTGADFHNPNSPTASSAELKAHQYKALAAIPSSPENV
jgi:hypothetical protein